MSDLTEKLSVLDKMSDSIMKIVQAGKSMAEQFERTGNTVGTAFGYICGKAAVASSKVDGFAASMESLRGAADNAADSADTLAGALGGSGGAAEELARNGGVLTPFGICRHRDLLWFTVFSRYFSCFSAVSGL